MYGRRARLGVLVPSGIITIEPEFNLMIPDGVTCHFHRTAFTGGGLKDLRKAEEKILDAIELLMHVQPSALAVTGTALTFVGGYESDKMLIRKIMERYSHITTTTTSTSVVDALHRLGIRKISIATPYLEEVARAASKFVSDSGIEVLDINWLNKEKALEISQIPEETVINLAREVDRPDSEAIFISCTALHAVEVIEVLESDLQKPVITSNQATIWSLLRLANITDKISGYGQLLAEY